jgi:RHH-type proline utilization regulon transcriptional repressor/proline dehydrogenase/delta 1-pyrroline-5-carboxylate dehydrogenase
MAYLVRRLLENTSNQSFLRAGFLEHVPVEKLLMNPVQLIRAKRETKAHQRSATDVAAFRNEPVTDFSVEANRVAFQRHLEEARRHLGATYPLVIDGATRTSAKTIDSVNPANPSEVVGRLASATVEDATDAIGAAKRAFRGWRDTAPERRARLLFKSAEIMRRRRLELAAWEVLECGKQWRESDADVAEAIDFCEYYGREMLRLSDPQRRHVPGEENETFYEPRGVAVVIAPWNFPIAILCGMTAAALVTGNTAIMKPAEQSSVVGAKLMEAFVEAGFPAGVMNFLPGVGEEIGPTLVESPDVAVIAFTGSRPVGLSINRSATEVPAGQEHIKRVITELGGKNAIIVDEDADLDEAVHGVAASAFGYAGQKCSACSRVVVLESIYDAFVSRLVEVTKSMKVGSAEDPANFLGPVIDHEAHQRILRYIETGKRESRLIHPLNPEPRTPNPDAGYFIEPHIFADVPPTATIAQEEIFGPVLAAIRARDLSEALAIANGTKYALTGGLYSRSPATIDRVRREFRVGNLYINRKITGALVDRQPFGGFKLSGIGSKAGGPDYLLQFMVPRTITENTLRRGFAPEATEAATEGAGGV